MCITLAFFNRFGWNLACSLLMEILSICMLLYRDFSLLTSQTSLPPNSPTGLKVKTYITTGFFNCFNWNLVCSNQMEGRIISLWFKKNALWQRHLNIWCYLTAPFDNAVGSGVSICKSIFDQIIDIRECKQKNSKTFSVFVFSNFIHLPFF